MVSDLIQIGHGDLAGDLHHRALRRPQAPEDHGGDGPVHRLAHDPSQEPDGGGERGTVRRAGVQAARGIATSWLSGCVYRGGG